MYLSVFYDHHFANWFKILIYSFYDIYIIKSIWTIEQNQVCILYFSSSCIYQSILGVSLNSMINTRDWFNLYIIMKMFSYFLLIELLSLWFSKKISLAKRINILNSLHEDYCTSGKITSWFDLTGEKFRESVRYYLSELSKIFSFYPQLFPSTSHFCLLSNNSLFSKLYTRKAAAVELFSAFGRRNSISNQVAREKKTARDKIHEKDKDSVEGERDGKSAAISRSLPSPTRISSVVIFSLSSSTSFFSSNIDLSAPSTSSDLIAPGPFVPIREKHPGLIYRVNIFPSYLSGFHNREI